MADWTYVNPKTGETPRWGMIVDLNRCVGCQTCTISCKHTNDTPPGVQWRRVLDVETGQFPDVERVFMVVGCQHCADPPCVPVCPTGATKQRQDGLVTMDYDLCIGCGYCAVACPYQARTIVHEQKGYYGEQTVQERHSAHEERIGVAQKCTFCIEKIDESYETGKLPGIDLDYTPACSASCIAEAIVFGDYNDPDSNVSRLAAENEFFQMHEELGTDPQIKYLYSTPAVPGREPDDKDRDDERLADPENPLVGERQTFWDIRAAMNFTLGGMSSGLGFIAMIAWLAGLLPAQNYGNLLIGSAALMGIGLFFVFLEIGRKLRAPFALLRPQSSWMTREVYVVAVYYPAIAAFFFLGWDWLLWVAGLSAFGFLYCQARILFAGKGIPAWRVPLMPWMLVFTGLLEGVGLYALGHAIVPAILPMGTLLPAMGLILAVINAGLWHAYRKSAKERGIPPLARQVLNRMTPVLHIVGHAVPAVLFAAALLAGGLPDLLVNLAGAAAVAGGAYWKIMVITRACYQQGFALGRYPQRGSGRYAAPARLEGYPGKAA